MKSIFNVQPIYNNSVMQMLIKNVKIIVQKKVFVIMENVCVWMFIKVKIVVALIVLIILIIFNVLINVQIMVNIQMKMIKLVNPAIKVVIHAMDLWKINVAHVKKDMSLKDLIVRKYKFLVINIVNNATVLVKMIVFHANIGKKNHFFIKNPFFQFFST